MKRFWMRPAIFIALVVLSAYGIFFAPASSTVLAQEPTATSITGIFITVITEEPQINVRMGPSSTVYPVVGKLNTGATAPALGRSAGGDWIQIEFPGAPYNTGWVYAPLVRVSPGELKISAPPPTPVPPATATIDPTFEAQYPTKTPTSVHLPTFTPPPLLTVPAYTQAPVEVSKSPVPLAVIIIALAVLGALGFALSLLLRR